MTIMKLRLIGILSVLCCVQWMSAQFTLDGKRPFYNRNDYILLVSLPEDMFGKSHTFRFAADDSIGWVGMDGYHITDRLWIPKISGDTVYTFLYRCNGSYWPAKLRFTHLPVVKLVGKIDEDYHVGEVLMQVPEDTITRRMKAKIKWAGSSTNRPWYKKHNYHIKFLDDTLGKMEVSFNGLRKDNHWRLNGNVIDMGRIRNKVSNELWVDMENKPYYADVQPNARSYVRSFFVEYYDNDNYRGFCDFSEYMDRKQLKLKKYDDAVGEFHGMLWKAKEATWQTLFAADSTYSNLEENWGEFELEYPNLEDVSPTDYHILSDAIEFVQNSDDATFRQHVGEYFDLPVLVDYYVFINVLLASDNTAKNIIWGCYDGAVDKKLTLAVWDLDAVMGQNWTNVDGYYHSPSVAPENELTDVSELAGNRLFGRLMEWPVFRKQVNDRYWQLRDNDLLNPDSLIQRFFTHYEFLSHTGALSREELMFDRSTDLSGRNLDFDSEFQYVGDWIRRRITYLDENTFKKEAVAIRGDVNDDNEVNVNDIALLVDILLSSTVDDDLLQRADVDQDGEVSVGDISTIIDIILTTT